MIPSSSFCYRCWPLGLIDQLCTFSFLRKQSKLVAINFTGWLCIKWRSMFFSLFRTSFTGWLLMFWKWIILSAQPYHAYLFQISLLFFIPLGPSPYHNCRFVHSSQLNRGTNTIPVEVFMWKNRQLVDLYSSAVVNTDHVACECCMWITGWVISSTIVYTSTDFTLVECNLWTPCEHLKRPQNTSWWGATKGEVYGDELCLNCGLPGFGCLLQKAGCLTKWILWVHPADLITFLIS